MQKSGYGINNAYRLERALPGAVGIRMLVWFALCLLDIQPTAEATDLNDVVNRFQQRYAHVETVTGGFEQTYRGPGIDQVESGLFWLKRPGLMRWEYLHPEEKLFVADGKESFLYVPKDRQVTIQPLTPSDLRNTPLEFLMGTESILRNFTVSWETKYKSKVDQAYLIRLTPRGRGFEYSSLILEIDKATWDLRHIVMREESGNTSEFLFTDVKTDVSIENSRFRFRPPKGVEVLRSASEQ